jgi:hypothetical protein
MRARTAQNKRPRALVRKTQIVKGELEPLGKQIAAHLEKMRGYEAKAQEKAGVELNKADEHWNSITQLLAEAKAKCDAGGFKAFKEKYCPNLSRSRIYELLAIGSGKKTVEESRTKNAEANKKYRAKKKSEPVHHVMDEPEVAETQTLLGNGEVIAPSSGKRKSMNTNDIALREFDAHLLRLCQMTAKAKATRFVGTALTTEQLNKLAVFLQAVAKGRPESPATSAEVTNNVGGGREIPPAALTGDDDDRPRARRDAEDVA